MSMRESIITRNLIINRQNLSDFKVYAASEGVYNAPERDIEEVEIQGRNGTLTIDHGRFNNIDIKYPMIMISENMEKDLEQLRNFLLAQRGYCRIEESFNPDEYREGRVPQKIKIKPKRYNNACTFDLEFDCKPQRFLKQGEHVIEITTTGATIRNPTAFEAKPLIRAYGTGSLTMGGETIAITAANEYTDIDCEMQNCFKGSTNCNGNATMTTGGFPKLLSGYNIITFSGFTKLEIKPRWWIV